MVAVIGLGNMGMAMLKRLLEKGHKPSAWDLDPAKRDAAREAGASIGADLKHSVADITMLSLPHDAAVARYSRKSCPPCPRALRLLIPQPCRRAPCAVLRNRPRRGAFSIWMRRSRVVPQVLRRAAWP